MSRSNNLASLADNATGLETLTVSDITDLSTGISNGNFLTANANVADNDFLRVDGTSIEGRSTSEMITDLFTAYKLGLKQLYYFNTYDGAGEIVDGETYHSYDGESEVYKEEEDCEACVILI